ncbi:MAG: flagellar biosynthesis protein FlgH [Deltaproteobacteria bacterium]|nr:MAG: flagellar biosynthesis protein FlgH [Deltaproteobacteria bacterium]
MRTLIFPLLFLSLLLTSCAQKKPEHIKISEPLEAGKTPVPSEHSPGSLWSAETPSIFSDHKARVVGDIVTVIISEKSRATRKATTSTGKKSSISASLPNLFGLEKAAVIENSNITPASLINTEFNNSFNGEGATARDSTFTASLTTQVIETYPNGNLKIRGGKEVMINNEVQIIYLTGIIRPTDITAANTIPSNKILNARISYTGEGAISDKQKPGWLMRSLDNVWPF